MMLLKDMKVRLLHVLLAIGFMLGSVLLSEIVKPRKHWADVVGEPHYANILPKKFGDWVAIENMGGAVVNPVQEQRLMELYSETLARAYVHKPTGRVLMLSVAYGKDQSTDTQLHTPEQCYPAQGFRVLERNDHDLNSPYGRIPAVRMQTTLGDQRFEPLTFFVRVGDGMARGSRERNFARLHMALQGFLIDGMLFRVSEVTRDPSSYQLQDKFILDLLGSVDGTVRERIIGKSGT
jgi:EpsI family protein